MRKIKLAAAVVLALCILCASALAGDNPVSLDTSSVADGQKDVPVDVVIELAFTNNVVNASVAENNAACISLACGNEDVPVEIIMADDQVEPNLKRIISVAPKSNLEEGKTYTLTISGKLTAKNGNSIGEDTRITFTTEGGASLVWLYIVIAAVIVLVALILILVRTKNGTKKQA